MKEEKILRKVLKDNGFKITKPRLFVFRLLLGQAPLSLGELVSQSKGRVDRVSVYRVVHLFEQLGIIRKVSLGWKYKVELSEIFLDHHHHITCIGCNKIVALKEDAAAEQLIDRLGKTAGFTITSHQLELQGYCRSCQKQQKLR